MDGDPHVLEAQRHQRLEPEDVADDRRGQVGDRPLLEQVQVVRDLRDVLVLPAGHRAHVVGLRLIVLVVGQPIGPDDCPGRGRGLAGHRRRGLNRIDPRLGCDPERAQDVGVLGLVVGVVIAHLGVRRDAGGPPVLLSVRRCGVGEHHLKTVQPFRRDRHHRATVT